MWQQSFSVLSTATPSALWRLWSDVTGWARWNPGIERIAIEGPFEAGTEFVMQPPGQEALRSQLASVRPLEGFEDETVLGEVCVRVDHRLERVDDTSLRIVYTAAVTGPDADQIGAMVTEDFPLVLRSLVALAESAR
jgi:hypothetical protein